MRVEQETVIPGEGEFGPGDEQRPALSEVERTVVAGPTTCPVCRTQNSARAEWCEECGFFLSGEPEEVTAQPAFARLVDSSTGAEYPLKDGENTVGRGACDVVLAGDAFVSRSHARIVVEQANIYLEDLGSSNGTFLNGEKVGPGQRVPIGAGDQVRFASTTLEVVAPEAVVEREGVREAVGTLEVEGGEGSRGPFRIFRGESLLGRHPANDVPLGFDGYVSGRHAKITAGEEGIFIEDLGSTNGTELNGRRVAAGVKEPLTAGDEIRLGKTALRFRVQSAECAVNGEGTGASGEGGQEG